MQAIWFSCSPQKFGGWFGVSATNWKPRKPSLEEKSPNLIPFWEPAQCLKACRSWRSQVFNEYVLPLLGTGFELVLQWISMISPETGCFPKLLVDHKASLKPYPLSWSESAWNQRCQQSHAVNVTSFRTFWSTSFLVVKTKTSHGTQKILQGIVSSKTKTHDTSTNPPLPCP